MPDVKWQDFCIKYTLSYSSPVQNCQEFYSRNEITPYNLWQTLQFMTHIIVSDKHYSLWQTLQIVTNTKKDRKQKKIYGDIEALADARRALKN